jgi:hypothetical protein
MDLFKLFYNHDQPLDILNRGRNGSGNKDRESTLQDFMSPTPTFSSFYLMGTRFPKEKIGLNQLDNFNQILDRLQKAFGDQAIQSPTGINSRLTDMIEKLSTGSAVIITNNNEDGSNIASEQFLKGELDPDNKNRQLQKLLEEGHKVIFKEVSRDGYDLHLYSKENIYPRLFSQFQELVDESFRFFSVNSKRMRSEKHFYFDTWRLDRPPHGAEEVFGDTVLRSKT